MRKLAIIGLGLMGSSIGLAARHRRLAGTICGFSRRKATRTEAARRRVVDVVAGSAEEAVAGADMVVFCLPVMVIPEAAASCRLCYKRNCVVTDVGSTKEWLGRSMAEALAGSGAVYVGSHPIAGSHHSGPAYARPDLYERAAVVVTRSLTGGGRGAAGAVRRVAAFWRALGARVLLMSAAEHDRTVAVTSHLPHLLAVALVRTALRGGSRTKWCLCGTGFADASRMAAGSEEIWDDILVTNSAPIEAAVERFGRIWKRVENMMKEGKFSQMSRYLAEARLLREAFGRTFKSGNRRGSGV